MPPHPENSNHQQLEDEKYMFRCIQLGRNALGTAAPNPMVGSVVVHHNSIIGEGYTSAYGGPHAEVNAISSVKHPDLLSGSTLYVTLEPCSHFGKTPPCSDLILKHNIPRVVIGIKDPHTKVAGRGIRKLQDSGCLVVQGILEAACRDHHKRFLTFHEKKRPYIILKWAESLDGYIAPERGKRSKNPGPYWITGMAARQLTHQWRGEEQAILVGANTVLQDNPSLTTRLWKGASPLRVVLNKNQEIPGTYHILDNQAKTLILAGGPPGLELHDIQVEQIDYSGNIAAQVAGVLHRQQVLSLLVEGGAQTLRTFIEAGLWDEARIFTGNTSFKKGLKAPTLSGRLVQHGGIGPDNLKIVRND